MVGDSPSKNMSDKLPLGKYEHYKGKQYEVIGVAKHSESLEQLVVYRALYGEHGLWIRPLKMFLEEVEIGSKKIPRFRFITSSEERVAVYSPTRRLSDDGTQG